MQEKEHINESPSYWSILTAEVRYSDKLTDFEKVLFSDITALTNKNGYCTASNAYFSRVFNKSQRSITRSITHLIENKFLKGEYIFDEQNKEIIERRLFIACHSMSRGIDKNVQGGIDKFVHRGIDKNVQDNNINNINNINMNKREGETSSPNARTIEKFKKPLLQDIKTYMAEYSEERKKDIDITNEAEMLFNYYEANGWRVGKNKMKDWKASVRTWVIRSTSDYKKGNDVFISSYL
jgi:hypothetical protein